jgi:uroporphyrinogen decarboxylase
MTAKDNALRIIRFDHPERVVEAPPCHNLCYLGCHHEGYEGGGHHMPVGSHWTDIWGTVWFREHDGVMGFPRGNPLDEPAKMKGYRWPDPDDERICGQIRRMAREFKGGDLFLGGTHRDTLWEKTYMLVGMECAMEYFYTEPEFMREVLHRVMDFQLGIAKHYLDAGIELAWLGDDLGTQQGPLLGLPLVREFMMPEYQRLFELYKRRPVIIEFHSCGNIEWAIPLFIELGVDVLNPIQATANDLQTVRRLSAGRLALQGGISTGLIMDGPAERIRQEVRRTLWELGRDGGYFCTPDQGMPFPEAHIAAFRETLDANGHYPLQPAPGAT